MSVAGELLAAYEAPMTALGELRDRNHDAGCAVAVAHCEGARGALRMAFGATVKWGGRFGSDDHRDAHRLLGFGDVAIRPTGERALIERGRMGPDGFFPDRDADGDVRPAVPDLLLDIAADARIVELASRPVFAGLLASALGCHEWVHPPSNRRSSLDLAAARAAVGLIARGRPFPRWSMAEAGWFVDARVAEELGRLGWRRLSLEFPAEALARCAILPPS